MTRESYTQVMRARRLFSHFSSSERGSVLILFAIGSLAVILVVGMAIDQHRRSLATDSYQEALDAAVLAGLREPSGRAARAAAVYAGVVASKPGAFPAGAGTPSFDDGDPRELRGALDFNLPTTFLKAAGVTSFAISVRSTAVRAATGDVCIYVRDPGAPQAFLINSGARLDAPQCEVHVASTAAPAAIYNAGSDIDTRRTCIESATIIDNGGAHPNVETDCRTAPDPFTASLPAAPSTACTFNGANYTGGVVNLSPGVYCGWFNFNAAPTVNFAPGVYVVRNGGWNVNGGVWSGAGVTFYFADTSVIQFNSAVAATLSAPTIGTYRNVLFYEAPGLPRSNFVFDDSLGFDMTGLVHLPSRDVTINSGAAFRTRRMAVVVNTIILNGINWSLEGVPGMGSSGSAEIYLAR